MPHFNPRSPCGERQLRTAFQIQKFYISIHAPRAGSDPGAGSVPPGCCRDFNPRSPCGERPLLTAHQNRPDAISIHAPRAGSDLALVVDELDLAISIHAPRAGSDVAGNMIRRPSSSFQSTLPVRGATPVQRGVQRGRIYFNPRSPCGERPPKGSSRPIYKRFQSTLPVRGATARTRSVCSVWYYFNPRSPCGERRRTVWVQHTEIAISIHAPRAGSDRKNSPGMGNIHRFQSTLPVRGATPIWTRME